MTDLWTMATILGLAVVTVITRGFFVFSSRPWRTWMDARIFGAAAGVAVYFWRRDTLLTILAGMAVYLPLHLAAGW